MVEQIRVLHVDDSRAAAQTTAEFLELEYDSLSVDVETDAEAVADAARAGAGTGSNPETTETTRATAGDRDREGSAGGDREGRSDGGRLEREAVAETDRAPREGSDAGIDLAEYDCVVSDYDMPGTDGLDLLSAVRAGHPEVAFVLYTGQGDERVASEAVSRGVDAYVRKDTGGQQYDLLANRIRESVEKHRAKRRTEWMAQAMETASDGIAMVGDDDRYVHVNESYAAQYGYDPEDLVGESWETVHGPDEVRRIRREVIPEAERTGRADTETAGLRADGERFPQALSVVRVEEGYVSVVRDLSERRRKQHALERLQETTTALVTADDPQTVADLVVDATQDVLGVSVNAVRLYDPEADALPPTAATAAAREVAGGDLPTFAADEGLIGRAFQRGEAVEYGPDVVDVDAAYDYADVEQGVILPLGDHGVLAAASREDDPDVDAATRSLVEVLATSATTALDRIERERFLRERERRIERLSERLPGRSTELELPADGAREGRGADAPAESDGAAADADWPGTDADAEAGASASVDGDGDGDPAAPIDPPDPDRGIALDRLVAAVETVQQGISIIDEEGRYEYVNEAYAAQYDRDPSDLVGREWTVTNTDEEVARLREEAFPVVRETGSWTGDSVGLRADGEQFPQRLALSQLPDGGWVCVGGDVTEKRRRQRELERYETLVEAVDDAVYVVDSEGRFSSVNESFLDLVGYDREEIVGSHVSIIKDDRAVATAERNLARILSSDGPEDVTFEVEIETADGRRVPCEDHMGVLPYDGDSFEGSVGVLRDVTERKRVERQLRALQETARKLNVAESVDEVGAIAVEAAAEVLDLPVTGVWEHADQEVLRPLALTDRARESFGRRPIEPGDGPVWTAYEDGEFAVREELDVVVGDDPDAPPEAAGVESEVVVPLGEYGVLRTASVDPGGFDPTTVDLIRALAANLQAALARADRERELQRRNDRLEEFAGVVSHDLRDPLHVADGQTRIAQRRSDDPEVVDALETVRETHDEMSTLIDDLLALARRGETVESLQPVDLAEAAEAAWDGVDARDVSATLQVEDPGRVLADPDRLDQLLANLLRNGVEHGAEDGSVSLRVGTLSDGEGFYVADDGPGFDPEQRDHAFGRGYATDDGGAGLGLAIVARIAEAHGWSPRATEAADGGARVEIRDVDCPD